MIRESDVMASNQSNSLGLIALNVVKTRFANRSCCKVHQLIKMHITKSFRESVFCITLLVAIINVGIRYNNGFHVQQINTLNICLNFDVGFFLLEDGGRYTLLKTRDRLDLNGKSSSQIASMS